MAATAYVDTAPEVKPHNGHFLMSFQSGDQTIPLLLTRHVLLFVVRSCDTALQAAFDEEHEPAPFTRKQRKA